MTKQLKVHDDIWEDLFELKKYKEETNGEVIRRLIKLHDLWVKALKNIKGGL